MLFTILTKFYMVSYIGGSPEIERAPTIVSRSEWGARPPRGITNLTTPVEYVVIHHSEKPEACFSEQKCISAMKSMQNYHMDIQKWDDIGYSFGVGGDNRAYEGRGWDRVGAHAPKVNRRSIGICTIGNWSDSLPPISQLNVIKDLITYGVFIGKISKNYKLIGHRQVRETNCPGDALYEEIRKWPQWESNPY